MAAETLKNRKSAKPNGSTVTAAAVNSDDDFWVKVNNHVAIKTELIVSNFLCVYTDLLLRTKNFISIGNEYF